MEESYDEPYWRDNLDAEQLAYVEQAIVADKERPSRDAIHRPLMKANGKRCSICGAQGVALVIDHDHITGFVRGLLCQACNSGLGFFKDDPERLYAAQRYLAKNYSHVAQVFYHQDKP